MEYVGTAYAGFQRQRDRATVQEVLEHAIASATGQEVTITAAGRTDAGAHATHQIIGFTTNSRLSPQTLQRAINAYLPSDIAVTGVADVLAGFHPRFDASSRTYRYLIWNRPIRSPFYAGRAAHIARHLDESAMAEGARFLAGTHDFSAFAAANSTPDRTRRIDRAEVHRDGDLVSVELEGSGFLKQMVRSIAGTLIQVGLGDIEPHAVADILESKNRERAGETAPASGLYLISVQYPVSPVSKERE